MDLKISATNGIPIYRQLYAQISSQIVSGALPPGAPLPPIRRLAAELGVSVITVRSAWEDLERDGFIVTAVGRGTTVADTPPGGLAARREAMARERLPQDLGYYKSLGLTAEELISLIEELY